MAAPETSARRPEVLLGTVAIEPNRWGTVRPDREPLVRLSHWQDRLAGLDVDGLEIWEGHLTRVGAAEAEAVLAGPLPVRIFNTYVDFDDPEPAARQEAARWVMRSGARAVKFNVGNDPSAESRYAERIAAWLQALPEDVAAVCECHQDISIAEDPAAAARILSAAGPPERVQALVHTHDPPDLLDRKFDALGERISHVHVNHLDTTALTHPELADVADQLQMTVDRLDALGFDGSYTLEFVAGLLTERDEPGQLLDQVAADLDVLHRILG